MSGARTVNDVLLFAVELVAWAAFGVWGWHVGQGPWRWGAAVVLPLAVIALWAVLAAPRSDRRLADPALFAFQLGVFLAGAGLLVLADRPVWGGALGVVAAVVVVLDRVLPAPAPRLTLRRGAHRGPSGGYSTTMTSNVNDAPDPASEEFLNEQNPVEKVSPGTTADAPATDPELISTDPAPSEDAGPGTDR